MMRVVTCGVGTQSFVFDLDAVRGIQRSDRVRPNDDATPLVGYLDTVPVYALADLLGVSLAERNRFRHVILTDVGGVVWGLLADDVSPVRMVAEEAVQALPRFLGDAQTSCFTGGVDLDGQLHLVLAPERLNPDASPSPVRFQPSPRPSFGTGAVVMQDRILLFGEQPVAGERPWGFGVGMERIVEVLECPVPVPLPGVAEAIRGLIRWRGTILPVFDLAHRFGLEFTPFDSTTRMFVMDAPGGRGYVGIVFRGRVRMLNLPIAHGPSNRVLPIDLSLVHAVIEWKEGTIVLPELATVLQT